MSPDASIAISGFAAGCGPLLAHSFRSRRSTGREAIEG
jgi:hypothetical protein